MRLTASLLLALTTTIAFADARVEIGPNGYNDVGDNKAHFPFSAADTDNEFYAVPDDLVFNAANNTVFARKQMELPYRMLPSSLKPAEGENPFGRRIVEVTGKETGEACTTEANNTEYATSWWTSTIKSFAVNIPNVRNVIMEIMCIKGTAVDGTTLSDALPQAN